MDSFLFFCRFSIRVLLFVIFIYTGITKLFHFYEFRNGIEEYELLPVLPRNKVFVSSLAAIVICITEIGAGIGMLSGFFIIEASILLFLLLLTFTGAIITNLLRKRRDLSCHCAGSKSHLISWWLVMRNALLAFITATLVLSPADPFTVSTLIMHRPIDTNLWLNIAIPAMFLAFGVLCAYRILYAIKEILKYT